MKVIKFILGFVLFLVLIVLLNTVLVYETLHYSILSYDMNEKIYEESEFKNELNSYISNMMKTDIKVDESGLFKFTESTFKNTLSYLLLKDDTMKAFNKEFISNAMDSVIQISLDEAFDSKDFSALISNKDLLSISDAEKLIDEALTKYGIEFSPEEIKTLSKELKKEEFSEQSFKENISYLLSSKMNVKFDLEEVIKSSLYIPRKIVEDVHYILGQFLVIQTILLTLLFVVILFRKKLVSVLLSIIAIISILVLQSYRIVFSIAEEALRNEKIILSYLNPMSDIIMKNINFISMGLFVFILFIILLNVLLRNSNMQERYKMPRIIISMILVAVIVYTGYMAYDNVHETYKEIESYDIYDELDHFEEHFKFDFDFTY